MKIHELTQGSPEWLAYRAQHFNASDAPAMMGVSPYKTRAQLLREMHTGVAAEVDIATQKRFDNGHRAEALARPLAEKIVGEDLYPVTGSLGRLSASFDGLTLDEDTIWEHKALSSQLRGAFAAIDGLVGGDDDAPGRLLPIHHRIQMEQQLHVSGAGRALFMATEWDAEGNLVEERSVWYLPDDELRGEILNGWAQFERDLAAYVLPEAAAPAPVGKAPEQLPALRIEVSGAVTASNLAEFKQTALTAIRSVNRELRTDQDFADAEKAVKWCTDVEARLKAAKENALSQTASIEALFRAIDEISGEARTVRLDLDKLVTRRKTEVREEAVAAARKVLDTHIATLNAEIAPMRILPVAADFAGAIKGLKTFASMQDKLDAALAAAKIAADASARAIRANVAVFNEKAAGYETLFADLGQLVHKPAEDFATLVQARIDTHRAAEERRARERAEAEERARQAAEQQRLADEERARQQAAQVVAQAAAPVVAPIVPPPAASTSAPAPSVMLASPAPRADEPATLKVSDINARIAPLKVDAAGLAEFGIRPAKVEGASKLYRETDFQTLCFAIKAHAERVRTTQPQAAAA